MIKSLTGCLWNIKNASCVNEKNIVEILLQNRGYSSDFLGATLKNSMPHPFSFVDMERAAGRIYKAMEDKQPIAIFGDYDVDGISATCVFLKFFNALGVRCDYVIPNRMDEGYGLSIHNIENYKNHLIVAVDCGSSSLEELKYAEDNGIDIVVIDHHKMSVIPNAVAIVNPHRPDEKDDFKYLCAAGLAFICVVGIGCILKSKGQGKVLPNLTDYLDLVALATVCDVVPLRELNRAFVVNGLKIIKQRKNLGISALLSMDEKSEVNAETIAFCLGPQINAAGRMKSADVSVRLLTTDNPSEAWNLAQELFSLNKERQEAEAQTTAEAMTFADETQKFVCAFNPKWHIGVIGITAGRIKEKHNKPSIMICCDNNGIGKASCRSVEGLDISAVIKKGVEKGIITAGGGHMLAGGFSLPVENIPQLQRFLQDEIDFEYKPKTFDADAVLNMSDVTQELLNRAEELAPFGEGNRTPLFIVKNAKINSVRTLKGKHVSLAISDGMGTTVKGISFGCVGSTLGNILLKKMSNLDFLGELSLANWNGNRYINFLIRDVARAEETEALSEAV